MASKDKGNDKASSKEKSSKEIKPVTEDSRFKSVHNDPRFRFPNFKNLKVKVDDRFNKKELKKLSGSSAKIDKYGRKLEEKDQKLSKYYEYDDESSSNDDEDEDEDEDEEEEEEEEENKKEDEDEEEEDVEALSRKIRGEEEELDRARGEGLLTSSSDSSSDDSSSDSESELDDVQSESDLELEENAPGESDPTSSFAVVNMDWDNLRAEDLMATFLSFVPKGGNIKSVKIYPSEFGKERMQREEVEGPPRELFKKKSKRKEESDSESDLDSDIDIQDAKELERVTRKLYEQDDGKEDYDSKALRRYQLQRLRYYYAVVKCDSVQTARNIYENVDGTEYESTANVFDLRYVPEDMEFDDNDVKDECFKVSPNYKPESRFVTDALQHSKVKLTWDETPKERLTLSSRPLSQKEIEANDFKAYLASDSDEDAPGKNGEDLDLKSKYQSLLGKSFKNGSESGNESDDVDMEITFDPGLKDGAEKDTNEDVSEETTIEAYKRKEKERRQKRLNKLKESKANADEEEVAKVELSKSSAKDKKQKSKDRSRRGDKDHDERSEKEKAALELVLMDNEQNNEHFNMKDVLKNEKSKRNKKSRKKNIDQEMTQDNFEANLNDPRFDEIFESHDFAIDPTSSEFKKTETMKKILKERSNRNKSGGAKKQNDTGIKKRKLKDGTDYEDAKSIVKKLKNKVK
ncbi:ESF1 [Candida theae]|uniref:ESF1 n=1 Tax=Candida theae TaxID=1198502 RepID=A0AAD5BCM6_9ASCO|nr:ESF1 [Candida theae]KAI5955463.1 ESF1 [Candida theae]